MTTELFNAPTQADTRNERAQRAVRAFRAMQPGLTGYARAITGKRSVSVQLAEGVPRTDGEKIFFKPPIALGDQTPHKRGDCEQRDRVTRKQLCPACRVREEVLIMIYHEIAHIVFGTFQEVSETQKIKALERAIEEAPNRYAQQVRDAWAQVPSYKTKDYMNLSSLISPFLPTLVNVLEDARVDESMFKARKGTRVMFDAMAKSIFEEGIEADDGSRHGWKDKPLNSQIVIGVFVLACRYDYIGWFHPKVEEALGDKKLNELTSRIDTLRSAEATYNLAFPILARLRELGFCLGPEEEPEPEEQDDEQDEEGTTDDGDDGKDDGESDGDGSSEDEDESGSPEDGSAPDQAEDSDDDDAGSDSGDGGDAGDADDETHSSGSAGDGLDDSSSSDSDEDAGSDAQSQDDDGEPGPGGFDADASGEDGADGDEERAGGDSDFSDEGEDSDSTGEPSPGELNDEVIDSGADEGMGGETAEAPEYGTAEQALEDVQVFSRHEAIHNHDPEPASTEEVADEAAMDKAIVQGMYFETSSVNVTGVREHKFGQSVLDDYGMDCSTGWTDMYGAKDQYDAYLKRMGISTDLTIPEDVIGPALIQMRRTFSDNARANFERHLRAGKINQRVLGKRAWAGDDRLFQKKRLPGKKSYAVIIGIDISGSTIGVNLALAKRAAMAQAELCARAGIEFAVYAHTASGNSKYDGKMYLDIYEIKSFDAPWSVKAKEAFDAISSDSENLDGHTIEYYRRLIEQHPATDKIILYYSDGKMPAANHNEELAILQREIAYCKARKITLLGVGIRTDSPRRHGLDTVQVNDDSDISKVVRHLQTSLLHHR